MHGGGAQPRHLLLLLIDGLGDVSLPQLSFRTPLQAARTPTLDALVAASCGALLGLVDPVAPGVACGSDTAHLSLLGYEPELARRGRGAFEALGAGLDLEEGDVAFKCNFAVLEEESGVVSSRRCDRDFEADGPVLCASLDGLRVTCPDGQGDATVHVRYATEHRAGLLLRGEGLCDRITGTGAPSSLFSSSARAHTRPRPAQRWAAAAALGAAGRLRARRAHGRAARQPLECGALCGPGRRCRVHVDAQHAIGRGENPRAPRARHGARRRRRRPLHGHGRR